MRDRTLVYVELDRRIRAEVALHVHRVASLCLPVGSRMVARSDAALAITGSSRDAIRTAVTLAHVAAASPIPLMMRIGLDFASELDATMPDGAARLAATASWGEIISTESIAEIAVEHALATAAPIGTFRLDAYLEPVALFVLRNRTGDADQLVYLDAVCGRAVLASEAPARTHYEGAMLRFCSRPCAAAFEASPERFLMRPDTSSRRRSGGLVT